MRKNRKDAIVRELAEGAKTYKELGKSIGISYAVIYQNVQELIRDGLIEELALTKDNGQLMFGLIAGGRDRSVVRIANMHVKPAPSVDLGEFITWSHGIWNAEEVDDTIMQKPMESVAYLYRRSKALRASDGDTRGPEAANMGTIAPIEIKVRLRNAEKHLRAQADVLRQIIVREELFDDSIGVMDRFGVEDADDPAKLDFELTQLGDHFVKRGPNA